MKQIKVITGYRDEMQVKIDNWMSSNLDVEILDLKGGGPNKHGVTICYIIYEKGVKL